MGYDILLGSFCGLSILARRILQRVFRLNHCYEQDLYWT